MLKRADVLALCLSAQSPVNASAHVTFINVTGVARHQPRNPREMFMTTRFSVLLSLVLVSIQNLATATVRCANADLSQLVKVVYVSPQGNDVVGCGQTATSPCKTIQQGIANCSGASCGVLVRYGEYGTGNAINVADGISLYGSCVFDGTPYRYRSTIIGNPAIQANGVNKPTVIDGFVILGSNAVNAGDASVAFTVSNSAGLVLRENVIASGKGGNGANGSTPSAGAGQLGVIGNASTGGAGGLACASNPPSGSTGRGGKGADTRPISSSCNIPRGVCDCSERRDGPVSTGANGVNSSSVLGGVGGPPGLPGCACNDGKSGNAGTGQNGSNGSMGAPGTQGGAPNADTKGSFAGTTWRPNFSGTGAAGQVGSGGGGGGAGGFSALTGSGTNRNGYAGGGGGGGGCGGPGGTGAQQGGASVPLVLFASSGAGLAASNALIPGPGGQGGNGGTGAGGGSGGPGGLGFSGPQLFVSQTTVLGAPVCSGTVPGRGGSGGNGGQGGAGGGGAGGNGGPSFGIALVNSSPLSAGNIVIYPAQPGSGGGPGPGGQNNATNKGPNGNAGSPGFSNDQNSIVSFTSLNSRTDSNQ